MAQQKVDRESPRSLGKKTFLEKRNSENMKGLFWAACLSKAMNRWNRNQFWNQFSIHKYNVLRLFEQWYFCPCFAHKTRDKAQQTVGSERPRLIFQQKWINSEHVQGNLHERIILSGLACLSKAMNRWNRNRFSSHKYNVLRLFEQWYFCPCLAHKTRDKAQQTVGPETWVSKIN
jgi:hypothetical protein